MPLCLSVLSPSNASPSPQQRGKKRKEKASERASERADQRERRRRAAAVHSRRAQLTRSVCVLHERVSLAPLSRSLVSTLHSLARSSCLSLSDSFRREPGGGDGDDDGGGGK